MTMRVAFLSNWESPAFTYQRHRWMTPRRAGVWEGLVATDSLWRADYVVVHQGLPGRSYQWGPPWKTPLLRHEPSCIAPH